MIDDKEIAIFLETHAEIAYTYKEHLIILKVTSSKHLLRIVQNNQQASRQEVRTGHLFTSPRRAKYIITGHGIELVPLRFVYKSTPPLEVNALNPQLIFFPCKIFEEASINHLTKETSFAPKME